MQHKANTLDLNTHLTYDNDDFENCLSIFKCQGFGERCDGLQVHIDDPLIIILDNPKHLFNMSKMIIVSISCVYVNTNKI